jgi:hypothetical protein
MSGIAPNKSPGFRRSRLAWLVTAACILALFGLGVTIVHFLWPSPLMFAVFMTVGQGSFALAMAIYLVVIFADLRRRKVL